MVWLEVGLNSTFKKRKKKSEEQSEGLQIIKSIKLNAAWLESLEDYFQKGALLGQKAALNLRYVDTRPNSQKLFPSI